MKNKRKKSASFNFIDSGFSAKTWDKETGLYNFPQRYYDARNVKWMTLDPMGPTLMTKKAGEVTSLNWYNYCGNNPVMYHDPSGLGEKEALIAANGDTGKNNNLKSLDRPDTPEEKTQKRSDQIIYDQKRNLQHSNRSNARKAPDVSDLKKDSAFKKPKMFNQYIWGSTKYHGKKLGDKWAMIACAITTEMNFISTEYTKKEGKELNRNLADRGIAKGLDDGFLEKDGGIKLGYPVQALNSMSEGVGLEGSWEWDYGQNGSSYTMVQVQGVPSLGGSHFVFGWSGGRSYFDVEDSTNKKRFDIFGNDLAIEVYKFKYVP